jgi:hypothetical protein
MFGFLNTILVILSAMCAMSCTTEKAKDGRGRSNPAETPSAESTPSSIPSSSNANLQEADATNERDLEI